MRAWAADAPSSSRSPSTSPASRTATREISALVAASQVGKRASASRNAAGVAHACDGLIEALEMGAPSTHHVGVAVTARGEPLAHVHRTASPSMGMRTPRSRAATMAAS